MPLTEIDFYKSRLSKLEPLFALKQQQINSLLEITEAVNNNWPINALVRVYESILIAQLGIQKIALLVKGDGNKWDCISYTGADVTFQQLDYNSFAEKFNDLTTVSTVSGYELPEFEFVIPVAHKKNVIGLAFLGDFRAGEELDTKEEKLKFTQTITNIILVANENKRLFKSQMDKAILEKELKLAADMQNMLVPTTMISNEQIETAAFYKPHKDIGGDYYDFIKISEEEFVFCISDISGKGVPAALLMANFQANLRAIVARNYALDTVVDLLNRKVGEITKGEKFITLFIAKYNMKSRLLTYVNAGHNPSIIHSPSSVELLDKGCTILGMFDILPFINTGEVKIEPGALLVNYTDGLTEATNEKGELFEVEGLMAYIAAHYSQPLNMFNANLVEHINEFKGSEDFDDDLTLLTVRFH
ncbi:MAG: serine/threonine-protein phosphatase [Bacteroidetes bacterium]|nr:serine/threonine-protein phosphatase [Bacteroidota bacterium]